MRLRSRIGSSPPTRSASFSAPSSEAGSGGLTQRMIAAPFSTLLRLAVVAPAASNSPSAIEAPSPAPFSTAVSAPSAANFFTVSGIAAQRVSPAASFRTAIFIPEGLPVGFDEEQRNEADDQANDRAPLHHLREARVIVNVHCDVLRRRTDQQRLLFGHHLSLCISMRLPGP